MRLSFFLLILCVFNVSASAFSQPLKLNVGKQTGSIGEMLTLIEQQTDYRFLYRNDQIDLSRQTTVDFTSKDLKTGLSQLFANTNINFTLMDNNLIVLAPVVQSRHTVSGSVISEKGETLPLANIVEKGTTNGTSTNLNGNYTLTVSSPNAVLVVTYVGYETLEVPVNGRTNITITLKEQRVMMSDVVITGYQTISKERATGSFVIVPIDAIEKKIQPSLKSVLEGQAAGVVLTKEGNIEIRGVSTISGVKDPLIVVDGYPLIGNGVTLETINPNNIQNITVLKDAVAASIYGARASNGVIVITTKKAEKGKYNIGYRSTYGVTLKPDLAKLNLSTVADYMDAELDLYNQNPNSYFNSYNNYYKISDYAYLLMAKDRGLLTAAEADARIAELRNQNAIGQIEENLIRPRQSFQHNLNISGGSEKNLFNGTLRYYTGSGNITANDESRFTFDINNLWTPKDWLSLRIISNINNSTNNSTGENLTSFTSFTSTSRILPYTNLYDANGNIASWSPVGQRRLQTYETYPGMKSVNYHPETDLPLYTVANNNLQIRMGGDITINLFKPLSASFGGSWIKGAASTRTIMDPESFSMRTAYNDGTSVTNPTKHYIPDGGKIDESRGDIMSWVIRGQLNYNQSFLGDKHRITAILGNEINKDTYQYTYMPTRLGYSPVSASYNSGFNPHEYNNNIGNIRGDMLFNANPMYLGSVSYGSNYGVRDNRFVSTYGNASYELMERYILTGSVRLDLTNFFGTDPKFRYKPTWAIGGTYKLAEEPFFSDLKPWMGRLNIRGSYGINGNISLNNTPYLILSVGQHNPTTGGVSYGISSYPNNTLRWERTQISNIGADMSLFRNRMNLSIEYYYKKSTDLIASDAVDQTTGVTSLPQNVGSISNRGFEVTAGGTLLARNKFRWHTNFISSYNTSMVDHYNVSRMYFTQFATASGILVEDYPLDGLWGARFAGLDNKGAATFYNLKDDKVAGGSLKAEDAVYLGSLKPIWDLGWTNSFTYKNLEASFMFIGKFGHKYRKDNFSGSNYNNRYVAQRWRQPGDENNTIYPVLKSWNMDMFYFPYSDVLVGNANYIKLRDFTLSYTLPRNLIPNLDLPGIKATFQTRNLFYITAKDTDIDPETSELNLSGGTGAMTNQAFTSLQLRPEFYFGFSINL